METRQKIQLDTLDLHGLVRVNLEKVYLDNKYEGPRGIEWEFSYENISNGEAKEIERGLEFGVLSILTMPFRLAIEEDRFEAAKLVAARNVPSPTPHYRHPLLYKSLRTPTSPPNRSCSWPPSSS